MMLYLVFIFLIIISLISFENIHAEKTEPISITISPSMQDVIFDGKWTNYFEWKQSSENQLSYDDSMIIHLRTAHYGDFIYVFVDPINDLTLDKGKDKSTICFDGKNNKSMISDKNDFCFSISLGSKQGVVFQGNSIDGLKGNFQKISTPVDFIAVSDISDKNDRYTATPHPSYEFKIPIKLIERSDNYGFFLSVYDANSQKFYTWPKESIRESFFKIPSPNSWGDLISPDKSLPEFHFPILILFVFFTTIIIIQYKSKIFYF